MRLVLQVPVEPLCTTLAPLRGRRTDRHSDLAPLPLRRLLKKSKSPSKDRRAGGVSPLVRFVGDWTRGLTPPARRRLLDFFSSLLRVAGRHDGGFEVLDGFKRLAQWRSDGLREVPVVVEPVSGIACKARLLQANAPPKTFSAMDQARVVASLAQQDGLSPCAIAKLLLLSHPLLLATPLDRLLPHRATPDPAPRPWASPAVSPRLSDAPGLRQPDDCDLGTRGQGPPVAPDLP